VWGSLYWNCRTWCITERPCVDVIHMVACPDTSTAVRPTSWGRLRFLFR
jgi:hypothetical protein